MENIVLGIKKGFGIWERFGTFEKRNSPDCSGIPRFLAWIERKAGNSSKKRKMLEIERKFLVTSDVFKSMAFAKKEIAQGYLNSMPERTVRIRIKGSLGYVTIKGKGNESGMSRFEWEKEIPVSEAKSLLELCEIGTIMKTRYEIKVGNHIFEVDEFYGENEGLILAEIELQTESDIFEKPSWLGLEVTNDYRYYNSYLSQNPFGKWSEK